jgi:hypothetical protein
MRDARRIDIPQGTLDLFMLQALALAAMAQVLGTAEIPAC